MNPCQLGLGSALVRRGIPKWIQTIINGVNSAAVQKIQRQERWSMYHPSCKDAMLLTKTMSAAYAAIPKMTSRFGRLVNTKVIVRE